MASTTLAFTSISASPSAMEISLVETLANLSKLATLKTTETVEAEVELLVNGGMDRRQPRMKRRAQDDKDQGQDETRESTKRFKAMESEAKTETTKNEENGKDEKHETSGKDEVKEKAKDTKKTRVECPKCRNLLPTDPHELKYHPRICYDETKLTFEHLNFLLNDRNVAKGTRSVMPMTTGERTKLRKKWRREATDDEYVVVGDGLRVIGYKGGSMNGMTLCNGLADPLVAVGDDEDGNPLVYFLSDFERPDGTGTDLEDAWRFFHSLGDNEVELIVTADEKERLDMMPLPWAERDTLDNWYYDQVIDRVIIKALQKIIPKESKKAATKVIVDVCAGDGRLIRKLTKLGYQKCVGFENCKELIKSAKEENEIDLTEMDVVEDYDKLPRCDVVIASGSVLTIEVGLKLSWAKQALEGIFEALRPGGWLIEIGVSQPFFSKEDYEAVGFTRFAQTWVPGLEGCVSINQAKNRKMNKGIHCYVAQKGT